MSHKITPGLIEEDIIKSMMHFVICQYDTKQKIYTQILFKPHWIDIKFWEAQVEVYPKSSQMNKLTRSCFFYCCVYIGLSNLVTKLRYVFVIQTSAGFGKWNCLVILFGSIWLIPNTQNPFFSLVLFIIIGHIYMYVRTYETRCLAYSFGSCLF